jgi:VanZ family protein
MSAELKSRFRTGAKICSGVIIILLLVAALGPAKWAPRTELGWQFDHFIGYFGITLFVCIAWPRPLLVGGIIMAVAALLESLQALTPDRSANLEAALWGAGGALAAALVAELFIQRHLVAVLTGVAAVLAWQSYGDAAKEVIATKAPELGWSPEAKQMIASWVQQLGWTKPATGPENTAAELPAPKMPQAAPLEQVVASTSKLGAPSLDQQTVEQRLAAVRESVEQLAVGQDQVLREIAKLHEEILRKTPASTQQLPALPARKPMPPPASSSSRAPIPPPPAPIPPPHP